jgi:Rps23 Pro-64 3,4-dihydroxylase Tpa1-like proline 4-hydroxylase
MGLAQSGRQARAEGVTVSDGADGKRPMALGAFTYRISVPAALPADPPPPPAAQAVEPWFVIDDFLPAGLADVILDSFIANQTAFFPSQTISRVAEYRQALEIPPTLPVFLPFEIALRNVLSQAYVRLGYSGQPIGHIDFGGNAYPNGGLFKKHSDNSAAVNQSRLVSYVYYLHRRPKGFHGGELVMYPLQGGLLDAEPMAVVPPSHNSLVLFRSEYLHEVLPVVVPGGQFGDSRFTINGWVHR